VECFNTGKCRNRSGDVILRDETQYGNLGEPSVVDLAVPLLLHDVGADLRKINRRKNDGGEFTPLHVVRSLSALGVKLAEKDEEKDLRLACE